MQMENNSSVVLSALPLYCDVLVWRQCYKGGEGGLKKIIAPHYLTKFEPQDSTTLC